MPTFRAIVKITDTYHVILEARTKDNAAMAIGRVVDELFPDGGVAEVDGFEVLRTDRVVTMGGVGRQSNGPEPELPL